MLYGSVTILNVHNLQKSYADRVLFKNLSFGIDAGEKVGLIGPNGVGKSTLFQILIGSLSADQGDAVFSKGVRLCFLEQEPRFASESTILDTVLEKSKDKADLVGSAYGLISQLGLDQFGENFKVDELSGGWKKRVALARELILEPDLLLLDEPTNHLDVSGILWLEKFLSSQRMAVMMITHDRLFLQRVCQRILDLDPRNPDFLLDIKGSYLEFTEAKESILRGQQAREEVLKNKLRREKEWLSRGPQARQTKQKARIQEAMELIDTVDEVKNRNLNRSANIDFGAAKRLPKKLIHAEGITKSFGNQILFKDLHLLIRPSTRIGLLGENGSGKSTLIKCLLGLEPPDQGKIEHAEDLQVSYFEQSKETLNLSKTVLENVCPEGDFVSFQGQFIHARSYLERFLFFGHHTGLLTSKLSGGERARLRLAQLMLKDAQVLVLDEPTNDLDTQTLDVLEEALRSFHGAVILVTHDRYFMDSVCSELLAFPKEKSSGELIRFADYFQWEEWFKSSGSENDAKKLVSEASAGNNSVAGETNSTKKAKTRMSFKDKFELENMETTIADLESALSDAEQAGDYTLMAKLQDEIDLKFKRWAELEQMSQG